MPGDEGLTPEQIRRLAQQREQAHEGQASSRPLSPDYEMVGLAGEVEFAKQFGFSVLGDLRGRGDGNKDAGLRVGSLTLDVKTARIPAHLLREKDKPHSDILILAGYCDATQQATLLGWEFDAVMVKCPVGVFNKDTPIPSHFKPRRHLRSMAELHAWVNAIRAKRGVDG